MRHRTGVALLGIALAAAVVPAASLGAKKGGGTVNVTKPVNLAIPDKGPAATAPFGLLSSTIAVGKQFKGRQVRDVNVMIQTTGVSATNNAAQGLRVRLTAPNGATSQLVAGLSPGNPIGPLTLDDEAPLLLQSGPPIDPRFLYTPWVGAAEPLMQPLAVMDGGPVRGNWTLSVADFLTGGTNTLVQWQLTVAAGKPFLTK